MPTSLQSQAAQTALVQAGVDITGLDNYDLMTVRQLVSKAIDRDWKPETLARRLQPVLGLGPRYAMAVENFRDGLEKGVTVKGKDGKTVRRTLSPQQISKRVADYTRRLKKHRAATVAAYEVRKSSMDAQRADWLSKQADGELSPFAVRIFKTHKDERTCKVCRPMNGRRISLSDPRGAPLHPNCRCTEVIMDGAIHKGVIRVSGR